MTREARLMSGIILITVPSIPVRWIFFADLVDEQEQRVHGEPIETEFLSRRARPRRCDRDSLAHLPDACGRGSAAPAPRLVRSNRSTTRCNSYFGGVLLLGATANRHASGWCCLSDLCWGGHSRSRGCRSRHWLAAISAICVDAFSPTRMRTRMAGRDAEVRSADFIVSSGWCSPQL